MAFPRLPLSPPPELPPLRRPVREWTRDVEAAGSGPEWNALASLPQTAACVEVSRAVQQARPAPDPVLVRTAEVDQWPGRATGHASHQQPRQLHRIGHTMRWRPASRGSATVVAMLADGPRLSPRRVRHRGAQSAPFVAVIGNDACWNTEHQIQLRTYGRELHGCSCCPRATSGPPRWARTGSTSRGRPTCPRRWSAGRGARRRQRHDRAGARADGRARRAPGRAGHCEFDHKSRKQRRGHRCFRVAGGANAHGQWFRARHSEILCVLCVLCVFRLRTGVSALQVSVWRDDESGALRERSRLEPDVLDVVTHRRDDPRRCDCRRRHVRQTRDDRERPRALDLPHARFRGRGGGGWSEPLSISRW
jgi:hypothetical protein